MKLQKLSSYIRGAVDQYNMIEENDKIAVGVSGGKDSTALLIGLKSLQRYYPKKFEIEAITVSLGFPGTDFSPLTDYCKTLGINHRIIETDIGEIIFDERKEKNPCSLCSTMRKGAFNSLAKELGCNKIALGHNKDDVIETFFLSLFYESRIYCFAPVSYLDRMDLYNIRPLIYVPENEIIDFVEKENIPIVKNLCPVDKYTKRQEIKEFVKTNSEQFEDFEQKVFGAIKRSQIKGWKGD